MRGGYKKFVIFSHIQIHALDVACNTEIHTLDMVLGIICRQV